MERGGRSLIVTTTDAPPLEWTGTRKLPIPPDISAYPSPEIAPTVTGYPIIYRIQSTVPLAYSVHHIQSSVPLPTYRTPVNLQPTVIEVSLPHQLLQIYQVSCSTPRTYYHSQFTAASLPNVSLLPYPFYRTPPTVPSLITVFISDPIDHLAQQQLLYARRCTGDELHRDSSALSSPNPSYNNLQPHSCATVPLDYGINSSSH